MSPDRAASLPVVSCPGLHLDSLGHYLAALGLLEVAARTWPSVRGAWGEEGFRLVGGPEGREALTAAVLAVASAGGLRRYERAWMASQGRDTREGVADHVALWRSDCSEEECDLLDAHIVTAARLCFNPVLGTGGNSGRRDFAKGWSAAVSALGGTKGSSKGLQADLDHFLFGGACASLDHWNGMSWFSETMPPWAMVLACEGLPLLAGKSSRRLGANTRRLGAFPFTTEAAAPVRENEAGRTLGEVWAPIWDRPMAVSEIAALLARGRAELGRAQAVTAASFAAAIVQRGVDAGVTELRRFLLVHTTSSQTFESTLAKTIRLDRQPARTTATAVERAVHLRDRLPQDERRNERWTFRGLRGPIDEALVDLAAMPDDLDAACALMDALWRALARVDDNKTFRGKRVAFRLLPAAWWTDLFAQTAPPPEAVLAMALASLQPSAPDGSGAASFLPYRLGVEPVGRRGEWFEFPKEAPQRRVWTGSDLVRDLGLVLRRRLFEAEGRASPLRATRSAPLSTIASFLRGELDDEAIARWLGRMCLFDWQWPGAAPWERAAASEPADAAMLLYGLLKPLFYPGPVQGRANEQPLIDPKSHAGSYAALARIAARLHAGQVEGAVEEARSRYRAAGRFPAAMAVSPDVTDPGRLLAALLIPTSPSPLLPLARRWLVPERMKETS